MNTRLEGHEPILVVDDTPSVIGLLRSTLNGAGYKVLVATNGEKALQRAGRSQPCLILLDVLMPGMDGFETCRRLKSDPATQDIPVLFLSALTDTFDLVKGFGSGAVDYLTKPVVKEELLARVRTHLMIGRLRRELQAANRHLEERVAARTGELTRANTALESEIRVRKQREDELKDAHQQLQRLLGFNEALLSAIPTPVFYKDRDGRYLGCNRAFTEVMGVTPEEMRGKTVFELWPGPYAQVYHQKDLELMARPVRQIHESAVQDKNGDVRQVVYAKDVYRDESDRVAGIVGAFADITELKQAEEKVRKFNQELEQRVAQRTAELARANEQLQQEIIERKAIEDALHRRLVALMKPLDATDITFNELFNLEEIQKIQDAFALATRVASIITTPEGIPITRPSGFCRLCQDIIRKTEKGRANCFRSDSVIGQHNPDGPIIRLCLSGGLWDAGASITVGGKHIANWLIGQVKNEAIDEDQILRYADEIGADKAEFRRALQEVPVMSNEHFERIAHALFVLANELSLKAYQNVQQARFITERRRAEENLSRSEQALADFFDQATIGIQWLDADGNILRANDAALALMGTERADCLHRPILPFFADAASAAELLAGLKRGKTIKNVSTRWQSREGVIRHVLIDADGVIENGRLVHSRWFIRDITDRVLMQEALVEAAEGERRRLGQDLHDGLCQLLTGIRLKTELIERRLEERPSAEVPSLRIVNELLVQAVDQTRQLASGLQPVEPEPDGLMLALEQLADTTHKLFGTACRCHIPQPVSLTDHNTATDLFRIAQEAVNNAIKHGKPTKVHVSLIQRGERLVLTVANDGEPFARSPRVGGMGLKIMRYRAQRIGATLRFRSNPRHGAVVRCSMPFSPSISNHHPQL